MRSAILAAVLLGAGCATLGTGEVGRLRVGGSDTMAILLRRWAEDFMRAHPRVVVETSGGGSGSGIERLIRGELEIAALSRPMLPVEVRRLHERQGVLGVSHRCAKDALVVYLNPANPVRELSSDQLRGIFSGRLASWRAVGGEDRPIELLRRQPTSGTHRLVEDLVLEAEPFSPRARVLPTTAAICDAVRHRPAAIGYGGIGWGAGLVRTRIDGVAPTAATVRSGEYPLARYLYLLTPRPPAGLAKRFVDWALGPEGQAVVEETGYVALWRGTETAPPPGRGGSGGAGRIER